MKSVNREKQTGKGVPSFFEAAGLEGTIKMHLGKAQKEAFEGLCLAVQWVRFCVSTKEGMG